LYPAWSADSFKISNIEEAKNIEYKYLIKNKDVSFCPFILFQTFCETGKLREMGTAVSAEWK
jgi:hypothetical protein